MGNMPVIKDLITDMESTHWTKIRRVTWLLPHGEPPEREYIVEPESMIDITQSMACIQCGTRLLLPLNGSRPRLHRPPPSPRPTAASATRATPDRRAPATSPPTRRGSRLHPASCCVDACPQGRGAMDQIGCGCAAKAGEEGIEGPNAATPTRSPSSDHREGTLDVGDAGPGVLPAGDPGKLLARASAGSAKRSTSLPTILQPLRRAPAEVKLRQAIPGTHHGSRATR
jgi:hypothetical protein